MIYKYKTKVNASVTKKENKLIKIKNFKIEKTNAIRKPKNLKGYIKLKKKIN